MIWFSLNLSIRACNCWRWSIILLLLSSSANFCSRINSENIIQSQKCKSNIQIWRFYTQICHKNTIKKRQKCHFADIFVIERLKNVERTHY